MGKVVILPVVRVERHKSEAQSLQSDRAYAAHSHEADNACSEINPDPDGAA